MILDSINCPKCGAPLSLQTNQKLVVCGYCNSSVRVSLEAKDQQPIAKQDEDIAPEVIDEVKRLLVLGLKTQAVEYYWSNARVSKDDAVVAVEAFNATLGYAPPLSTMGVLMYVGFMLLSYAGVMGAVMLWLKGWSVVSVIVIIVALVFAYMNWFAFNKGLKSYWLVLRGTPAQATILKSWFIKNTPIPGHQQPAELLRLLLDVHPTKGAKYQAEANCFVGPISRPKFQPGSVIEVKCDVNDRKKVVVIGAGKG